MGNLFDTTGAKPSGGSLFTNKPLSPKAEAAKDESAKPAETVLKTSGSLFESKKDADVGGSLFGAPKKETGGSLFGAAPAKANDEPTKASADAPKSKDETPEKKSGGSLFGMKPATGSLFGNPSAGGSGLF